MPAAPTVVRATAVFLVCAGGLAACGLVSPKAHASPHAPTIAAVARARFILAVDLDHGGLLVSPPPTRVSTAVSESQADAMFEAADAVQGPHAFAIFGLGVVTVAPRVEQPTTTVPATVPSTAPTAGTTATTAAPSPTTTTTAVTTTTTTVPSASSTAVPPTTVAGASPPPTSLPQYRRRLAWVGIVWPAPETCAGSTTTQPATATSYVAIIINADTGHGVLAYRSGGSTTCPGSPQTATVTEPNELLSVPWQPVGPASTAVQIEVPACGRYYGWTQIQGAGGAVDDQVVVSVPFDPACGSTAAQSQSVDQVVPLGSGQNLVDHAAVGPVQALQALPND